MAKTKAQLEKEKNQLVKQRRAQRQANAPKPVRASDLEKLRNQAIKKAREERAARRGTRIKARKPVK